MVKSGEIPTSNCSFTLPHFPWKSWALGNSPTVSKSCCQPCWWCRWLFWTTLSRSWSWASCIVREEARDGSCWCFVCEVAGPWWVWLCLCSTSIWLLARTGLTWRGRNGFTNSWRGCIPCVVVFSGVAKHRELFPSPWGCVSVFPLFHKSGYLRNRQLLLVFRCTQIFDGGTAVWEGRGQPQKEEE